MAETYKVYIGNLPYDCTQADIENILQEVEKDIEELRKFDIHMVRDRETDNFKGFAYVQVSNAEQHKAILELNGVEFDGRNLRIDKATEKSGGGGGRGGRGGARGGRGGPHRGGHFEGGRGGGHHDGQRGGYQQRERKNGDFEVVRNRRNSHRSSGGAQQQQHQKEERHQANDEAERPRLQLKPKTTDAKELEEKKKKEQEEEAARREKIFGH